MKKIAKITLLFTIIGIGQLYGMEMQPSHETLLPELKQEIVNTALATSNNVDEVINMIEKLSALHGIAFDKLFNLKDFTKLVHLLAGEDLYQIHVVAEKFKTSIANEYLKLNKDLIKLIQSDECSLPKDSDVETIAELINNDADVNFLDTTNGSYHLTPLTAAMHFSKPDIVKLLLKSGAQTSNSYVKRELIIMKARVNRYHDEQAKMIQQMLEEAMK